MTDITPPNPSQFAPTRDQLYRLSRLRPEEQDALTQMLTDGDTEALQRLYRLEQFAENRYGLYTDDDPTESWRDRMLEFDKLTAAVEAGIDSEKLFVLPGGAIVGTEVDVNTQAVLRENKTCIGAAIIWGASTYLDPQSTATIRNGTAIGNAQVTRSSLGANVTIEDSIVSDTNFYLAPENSEDLEASVGGARIAGHSIVQECVIEGPSHIDASTLESVRLYEDCTLKGVEANGLIASDCVLEDTKVNMERLNPHKYTVFELNDVTAKDSEFLSGDYGNEIHNARFDRATVINCSGSTGGLEATGNFRRSNIGMIGGHPVVTPL